MMMDTQLCKIKRFALRGLHYNARAVSEWTTGLLISARTEGNIIHLMKQPVMCTAAVRTQRWHSCGLCL